MASVFEWKNLGCEEEYVLVVEEGKARAYTAGYCCAVWTPAQLRRADYRETDKGCLEVQCPDGGWLECFWSYTNYPLASSWEAFTKEVIAACIASGGVDSDAELETEAS